MRVVEPYPAGENAVECDESPGPNTSGLGETWPTAVLALVTGTDTVNPPRMAWSVDLVRVTGSSRDAVTSIGVAVAPGLVAMAAGENRTKPDGSTVTPEIALL